MATNITLNDLVEAIAGAVIHAQDRVERHQTSIIRNYFDEDGRPLSVRLRVPSLREDADEFSEEELVAPLLAIVGTSRLAIEELEISTTVTLGDLTLLAAGEGSATSGEKKEAEEEEEKKGGPGKQKSQPGEAFPHKDEGGMKSVRLDLGSLIRTREA